MWIAGFPILILLHKSKVEHTDIITRFLFTFITHTEHLHFPNTFLAIWKSRHRHLGISISIGIGIALALQETYFVLRSIYFCLSKFYMKKASMVKYFSSTIADPPGSFSRCLVQLFCTKLVSARF